MDEPKHVAPLPECLVRFSDIDRKQDMVIRLLKGNGHEENCVLTRLIKIELAVGTLRRVTWLMVSTIIVAVLTAAVGAMVATRFGVS